MIWSMPTSIDPARQPFIPDFELESALWEQGVRCVAGVDEAGRGALAGPVTAAAVILPPDPSLVVILEGVDDSKRLTPRQRVTWAVRLKGIVLAWEVGLATHSEIDMLGIVPAVQLAVGRAVRRLRVQPEHILVDYVNLPGITVPHTAVTKGDQRSLSIAAASIFAKTARDAMMCQLDEEYPGYGFAEHKGYGTANHRAALDRMGVCPVHRRSFRLGG